MGSGWLVQTPLSFVQSTHDENTLGIFSASHLTNNCRTRKFGSCVRKLIVSFISAGAVQSWDSYERSALEVVNTAQTASRGMLCTLKMLRMGMPCNPTRSTAQQKDALCIPYLSRPVVALPAKQYSTIFGTLKNETGRNNRHPLVSLASTLPTQHSLAVLSYLKRGIFYLFQPMECQTDIDAKRHQNERTKLLKLLHTSF